MAQVKYADIKTKLYDIASDYDQLTAIIKAHTNINIDTFEFDKLVFNKDGSAFTDEDLDELFTKASAQ